MIRKIARLFLMFFLSVFTLYLVFLSVISVSIGFANSERPGFWMPVLWGALIFSFGLFIIRLIVHLFKQMKAKEKYPYY